MALEQTPLIEAKINGEGQLVLSARHAPEGALIRYAYPWEGKRLLFIHGPYLAPIDPLPGKEVRFRLFDGRKGISEMQSFVFPGEASGEKLSTTLIACTQNRDFSAYEWQKRHSAAVECVGRKKPGLLFIGDSITHFFGGEPVEPNPNPEYRVAPDLWDESFGRWNPVNLGFGNDRIENAIWRVRHGELDGAAPDAVVVILIGTNNLRVNNNDEIYRGIRCLCDEITRKIPGGRILLQGVYPRISDTERVPEINAMLESLTERENIFFCTPGKAMGASDYTPLPGMTRDGVHPTRAGYELAALELHRQIGVLKG